MGQKKTHKGERLKVVIINSYNQKTFEYYADTNNDKDLAKLINELEYVGIDFHKAIKLSIQHREDGWW